MSSEKDEFDLRAEEVENRIDYTPGRIHGPAADRAVEHNRRVIAQALREAAAR